MAQDPFQSAEADALSLLQQCRPLLQDYLRIRSTASSANAPELVETRQELEATLTDLSADLQDLMDAVRAVEGAPARYGLSQTEVDRRKQVVSGIEAEIEDMRRRVKDGASAADRQRAASLAHPSTFDDTDPLAGQQDDDDFAEWEEQRQMEIMHEQDEALDGVFKTVGNLRAQADTMGRELEEQAVLLEDTDEITDRVGGKLTKGMKGIRYVLERNEGECLRLTRQNIAGLFLTWQYRQMVQLLYWDLDLCFDLAVGFGACHLNISAWQIGDKTMCSQT